ncbi:putative metallo-beta-lactamase, ribonuclease Z/Hydroxyacylglutathione hydrolase [Helianthus annuus]|uniref:Metallo-beta-lactamase, ribonuclease Z/Hydroxyacylglutathione hydrolase n=2 Tax=Helianthus annuus TaxID=4232 RepID=A0A9K3GVM5_HELAN|nr:putative hydrolase C777.06c isoform X1 [Helianthus annuus]XP_035842409.1 putative hydrolase C777.06c isoform X1 [Helianthus annuus]KAF5757090.1 putative metallo-beta-lactamase, ribonuclease Z/Hydroxyacylglutathione hydrolase [Helianthus annuus]KAJ0448949.1 putative metallo-beta-lactamase, ribonuclease Z/Hydroxyacylglutathione hydrolase [Helianthus annuus]KAJ0814806.1 putative metallo-beta-lactamase, ribonuclease Z/Hydroxyacylglutathione hydrolase [Helianthus annuus]
MDVGNVISENGNCQQPPHSALIFLGSGCSSAVPNAMCLINPSDPPCKVCFQSLSTPPERNPNYRCNTSLLIDYCPSGGEHKYILIDVGKTFREQVLRWFTFHKIPQIDSIVLTHEHADAVLGLDDIRAVQPFSPVNEIEPTPIFLNQHAMDSLKVKFPYLVQKKLKAGQEVRRVAQLEWKVIENDCKSSFVASGLELVPLPVMHGEDYVCLGFLFGKNSKVAYISDISRFIEETELRISKREGNQLDLLILDTLYRNNSHNTHFCFPQTLEAIKRLEPKRAYLIGMTHEFDHHRDNEFLQDWSKREGIPVQLAHDGLRIPIHL